MRTALVAQSDASCLLMSLVRNGCDVVRGSIATANLQFSLWNDSQASRRGDSFCGLSGISAFFFAKVFFGVCSDFLAPLTEVVFFFGVSSIFGASGVSSLFGTASPSPALKKRSADRRELMGPEA